MNVKVEIINIDDIPPEGKELSFELDSSSFNERLNLSKDLKDGATVLKKAPKTDLKVEVRGVTVLLEGTATLSAEAYCSRCSEPATIELNPEVSMVLKPRKSQDEEEDLNISFYEGKEINLAPIIEEQLILGLPYKVLCKPDCLGLCPICGENLNFNGKCSCQPEKESKPGSFMPFADLKSKLKV